jgi:CO dehydrogenase maturation factor
VAFTIAVSGKGGTGKTTVAALIVRYLLDHNRKPIFVVDADPNSSLGLNLGLPVDGTIGQLRQEIVEEGENLPAGMSRVEYFRYRMQDLIVEADGFDLLTMGRGEGPECYCAVNNLLRTFVDELDRKYRYVVLDNEAGMEHLSRRTTQNVDLLLAVSGPSIVDLRAARRIRELADELRLVVRQRGLLLNRADAPLGEVQRAAIADTGLEVWGRIPSDEDILARSLVGDSILDLPNHSPALVAVGQALDRLWAPPAF